MIYFQKSWSSQYLVIIRQLLIIFTDYYRQDMEIVFVPRYKEVCIAKDYYEYNLPKETQSVTISFEILPSLSLQPSQFIITTYHSDLPSLSLQPSQFNIATFPVYHCNLPSLSLRPSQFIIATFPDYHCDLPSLSLRLLLNLVVLQDCIYYSYIIVTLHVVFPEI